MFNFGYLLIYIYLIIFCRFSSNVWLCWLILLMNLKIDHITPPPQISASVSLWCCSISKRKGPGLLTSTEEGQRCLKMRVNILVHILLDFHTFRSFSLFTSLEGAVVAFSNDPFAIPVINGPVQTVSAHRCRKIYVCFFCDKK